MREPRDGYGRCAQCGLPEGHIETCRYRREWRRLRVGEYPPPGPSRPQDFHPWREAVRSAAKLVTRRPWGRLIDGLVPRKHRHAYFMYLLGPTRPKYMLWLTAVYCGQAWSEFLLGDPELRVWRWSGDDAA